ncbi:hypothetical protein R3P38DRAFT_2816427 [Favolaschia claudopus]|uniref:Uncharacterized protein n=1 Tax=Favolaschia claudopus TaxID=2862362 RepID=A0AAV9YYZ3_9AGAR
MRPASPLHPQATILLLCPLYQMLFTKKQKHKHSLKLLAQIKATAKDPTHNNIDDLTAEADEWAKTLADWQAIILLGEPELPVEQHWDLEVVKILEVLSLYHVVPEFKLERHYDPRVYFRCYVKHKMKWMASWAADDGYTFFFMLRGSSLGPSHKMWRDLNYGGFLIGISI